MFPLEVRAHRTISSSPTGSGLDVVALRRAAKSMTRWPRPTLAVAMRDGPDSEANLYIRRSFPIQTEDLRAPTS